MAKTEEISTKGLDTLSRNFLGVSSDPGSKEVIAVQPGQKANPETLKRYDEERKKDFIKRAGSFTEDLVAFVVQQRRIRSLSDEETIFALALANINLRESYGSAQDSETKLTTEQRQALLDKFDGLCYAAQEYYDANS